MAKKFIPFYNVDNSVGKGGINSPEDVLLVQFFLTEVAKVGPHQMPPPKTPLPINGVPSPQLNEWIEWFQAAVKNAGKNVTKDGKVDPAKMHGNDIYHNGTGTILHLNISYRKRFRAEHNVLENAQNCPLPLKIKFSKDVVG